jgi:hypothetical protein
MDIDFKTATTDTSTPRESEFVENIHGVTTNIVENTNQAVLGMIGLGDVFNELPLNEKAQIKTIADTLDSLVSKRGLQNTPEVYEKLFRELRDDMGIDVNTDPAILLTKLGETLSAWRDLSFIRDAEVKQDLFIKLARAKTSKEMDSIVLETMEKYGQ